MPNSRPLLRKTHVTTERRLERLGFHRQRRWRHQGSEGAHVCARRRTAIDLLGRGTIGAAGALSPFFGSPIVVAQMRLPVLKS
jgi:hypothetical protein